MNLPGYQYQQLGVILLKLINNVMQDWRLFTNKTSSIHSSLKIVCMHGDHHLAKQGNMMKTQQ
jgi:hypothetical protein